VTDPIDRALKGADARKRFRPKTDTTIELTEKMFVTNADLVRNLPNAESFATAPDNLQRVAHRGWRFGATANSVEQPVFDQSESLIVIKRFTETFAEPIDLAAQNGVQFHNATGKLAERQTQERPGATARKRTPMRCTSPASSITMGAVRSPEIQLCRNEVERE
jgi:hypothetical protein